jgi:type IV secretion system protein VirD4
VNRLGGLPAGPGGGEPAVVGAALLLGGLVGAVWAGAQVAALILGGHRPLPVGLLDTLRALPHLAGNPAHPRRAWPRIAARGLPGPVGYWAATIIPLAVAAVAAIAVASAMTGGAGVARRRRMGLDPEARFARVWDLSALWVTRPETGRMILGSVGRWPLRRLVATEDATRPLDDAVPRLLRRRTARRRGDRGAVLVVGPARCGKTTALAIPAILEWDGPLVALSVKTDLLGATITRRRRLGQVRVFDPTGITGQPGSGWSPLHAATSLAGARQAARAVANSTEWNTGGSGDMSFWVGAAEDLLAALLWTAARAGMGMDAVVGWITGMDKTTVTVLLTGFAGHTNPVVAADGRQVRDGFTGLWRNDARQTSSVYLVARQMIRPWQEPAVAASATGTAIDLDWLLSHPPDREAAGGVVGNSLYLSADLDDAERLAPVLGGLVDDLLREVYAQVAVTGRPLDPPLLVVLDEAGNWPMRNLPGRISTAAGMGIQLVLVYQSKAQIDAAYGAKADVIVANAVTKIFFAGLSDRSTLDYASSLLGQEHITARSTSGDLTLDGSGRRGISDAPTRVELMPAALLRQVAPGQALLIHNTLPPAHLHGRYWFRDPHLRALAAGPTPTRTTRPRRRRRRWRGEPDQDTPGWAETTR